MAKQKQSDSDRQITGIAITAKGKIKITFNEITEIPPVEGAEESTTDVNEYSIKTKRKPHKDLLDAMKKLRKDALAICEMNFDGKAIGSLNVIGIKITGDIVLRQSRVVMTIAKEVKRTGKQIEWSTPQVTMYGESEYEKAEEMSKLIQALIDETWAYLDGKCEGESQLPLFPTVELATA